VGEHNDDSPDTEDDEWNSPRVQEREDRSGNPGGPDIPGKVHDPRHDVGDDPDGTLPRGEPLSHPSTSFEMMLIAIYHIIVDKSR